MKWERSEQLTGIACQKWYKRQRKDCPVSERRVKFYSKLCNCGKVRRFGGHSISIACKTMVCSRCCARYYRLKAIQFLKQYPNASRDDFRVVTIGLGFTYDLELAFSKIRNYRDRLSRSIDNRKIKKSQTMQVWKDFSILGSFEISSFKPVDFHRMGDKIKKQFVEKYGYDENRILEDTVFHPHMHAVIYSNGLQDSDLHRLFGKYGKHTYIGPIKRKHSIEHNVKKFMIYSSKVRYANKFGDNTIEEWDIDRIRKYCDVVSMQKGMQGRKIFKKRSKMKENIVDKGEVV